MSFGSLLGGLAGPLLGGLFGGGGGNSGGVNPNISNAFNQNFNNQQSFTDLLANAFANQGLPLANQVSGIYSGALNQNVSPYSLSQVINQSSLNNPIIQQYLQGMTSLNLDPTVQAYINAMNPQTQATQGQANLSQQLQSAYEQAQQATAGKFSGTGPGEGPSQSLAESYLQQTAGAGADLQAQIAAMMSQAAANQLQATLGARGAAQGANANALGAYEGLSQQQLQNYLSLLGGAQGAAGQSAYNPALALGGYSNLGNILQQIAAGQGQQNAGNLAGLGGILGPLFNNWGSIFGGGNQGAGSTSYNTGLGSVLGGAYGGLGGTYGGIGGDQNLLGNLLGGAAGGAAGFGF